MKGVYAVFFESPNQKIEVGALGQISFEEGIYIYVGSAMNSAEKRISRHFSETDNLHWHVDYFSNEVEAKDYMVIPEKSSFECELASAIENIGDPVEKFGASDCGCGSHLFRLEESKLET